MTASIININTSEVIATANYKYEKSAKKWFEKVATIKKLDKTQHIFKIQY